MKNDLNPSVSTVALFIPCIVDASYPEVGEAVVTVLQRAGVKVHYPVRQTCCGQPAYNSGFRKIAVKAAKHFIEVFEKAEAVVSPSGSCVHMVRRHYPQLLCQDGQWRDRAEVVSRKTHEFSEFLVDVLGITNVGAYFKGRVTYHDSCHLSRGLGINAQPRQLIGKIQGATFVEMDDSDRCCGFGGAFSVKYPEISACLTEDKVKNILATGADVVVGGDMGCLMNIEGMLHRKRSRVKALHIAQILSGANI